MGHEVKGKVAVITGGASGIGLSCAKELLKNNLQAVAIVDFNEEQGIKAKEEIIEEFGKNKAIFIKTDVTEKQQLENAFKTVMETFQHLDIVVNSAGIFSDLTWEREISINFTATISSILLALTHLTKNKSSIIVNISSLAGLIPEPSCPIYAATKWGIIGATRSFGSLETLEMRKGIRIIAVCPGLTVTPLTDCSDKFAGRFLSPQYDQLVYEGIKNLNKQGPDAVAKAIVDLVKNGDSGTVWLVEGGESKEVNFTSYE